MKMLQTLFSIYIGVTCTQFILPAQEYRWNAHGFFAVGSSIFEGQGTFKGGGAGAEGFLWKGLAAGADFSAFHESYGSTSRSFGHAGANAAYHFTKRDKGRGLDPFVLFGVGGFFPDEKRAVVHGGAGAVYWFTQRVGARFELRVGERSRADDVVLMLRVGMALR